MLQLFMALQLLDENSQLFGQFPQQEEIVGQPVAPRNVAPQQQSTHFAAIVATEEGKAQTLAILADGDTLGRLACGLDQGWIGNARHAAEIFHRDAVAGEAADAADLGAHRLDGGVERGGDGGCRLDRPAQGAQQMDDQALAVARLCQLRLARLLRGDVAGEAPGAAEGAGCRQWLALDQQADRALALGIHPDLGPAMGAGAGKGLVGGLGEREFPGLAADQLAWGIAHGDGAGDEGEGTVGIHFPGEIGGGIDEFLEALPGIDERATERPFQADVAGEQQDTALNTPQGASAGAGQERQVKRLDLAVGGGDFERRDAAGIAAPSRQQGIGQFRGRGRQKGYERGRCRVGRHNLALPTQQQGRVAIHRKGSVRREQALGRRERRFL